MRAKRILYLSHYHGIGGAEKSLLLLVDHLSRNKFEPVVVVPREGAFADLLRAHRHRVHVVSALMYYWPASIWKLVLKFLLMMLMAPVVVTRLARLVKEERIDLIHVNSLANPFGVLVAWVTRRPLVWHVRDIYGGWSLPWIRWLVGRANRVIFISQSVEDGLGLHSAEGSVVYNAIPVEGHVVGRTRRAGQGGPVVGCLSKLEPWKGQDDLLRAIALLVNSFPEIRCVLAGEDPSSDQRFQRQLQSLAQELGIADRVSFVGFQHDVFALLCDWDALVVASWAEPFGRVILEAMVAGVPVVAAAGGGVPEIVRHEVNGLLFPAKDWNGLATQLARLLGSTQLQERLAGAGHQNVRERFSIGAQVAQIEQIYTGLLNDIDGGHSQ